MLVQQRHELTKTRIVDAFERAISTNETATQEISWWKELLAKTRTTLPKPSQSEESEVYKHLVLDLFLKEKID